MNNFIKKSLMLIVSASMVVPAASALSYADSSMTRNISGNDRFSTAVSIAKNGWKDGSNNVILVNSKAVADSLSVAPLASKLKAPVLLTESGLLSNITDNEISSLKAKQIIIIGGYSSVSENIEKNLKARGYKVERISGNTRIETSINIANKLKSISKDEIKEGFVVNGMKGLADAAGAGAIAAKKNSPIIFADKGSSNEIRSSIDKLGIGNVYLIGGTTSLPTSFDSVSGNTVRISGDNRQETNLNLIKKFYNNYKTVYIADDGSTNASKLIDSVLINAGIIASNSSDSQAYEMPSVKEEKPDVSDDSKKVDDTNVQSAKVEEKAADQQEKKDTSAESKVNQISSEDVVSGGVKKSEKVEANTQKSSSNLSEGPVMLVSGERGLSYNQMAALNSEENRPESIVQVSGGNNFKKYINDISDFIVNKDNKKAQDAFNSMMAYKNVNIGYNVGGVKKSLDGNSILQMMECNAGTGFNINFNKDKAKKFVSGIDVSRLSSTGNNAYAYWKNGKVVIDRNGFGVNVNADKETSRLLDMLKSGKSYFNLVPSYTKKDAPKGAKNLGKKYVQIDLKTQHMWVWDGNKQIVSTPIVSGNPNRGMATPPGIFSIKKMMRNAVLRGPGYASPVKYWIPFNGSIGIHDAYWQPVYGGRRYLYAGSHGCINTPLKAVGVLYNNVSVGTPVIVQSNSNYR